ncbi:MAG: succinate--CoA ligase subunit alpha [Candidatus Coatesbacteria bacterium]|nr:succinate--CoA ligase subunit alpha [Candidatus Coatesbacteria bacterium]
MSILIDEEKRVLIQGVTGREGLVRSKLMLDYGTQVIAGTSPGKSGETVHNLPVYDTVQEAIESEGDFDISVIFVPGPYVRSAALEAIHAGIPLCVLVPDRVPVHDVCYISALAKERGMRFVGPNTLGVMSPGRALVGMIGGRSEFAKEHFKRGPVGVVSRSGGITTSIAYYLNKIGIGQTTIMHVGGDPIIGINLAEAVRQFEDDDETQAVVMFGEIGSTQEEQVAALVASGSFSKPLIAFIGGAAARQGMRFSHAGAIIEGGRGTHEGKTKALRRAGCVVAENFSDLPHITREVLNGTR